MQLMMLIGYDYLEDGGYTSIEYAIKSMLLILFNEDYKI